MKCVAQEHGFGCGVACVASVLGCNYKTALKKFKKPQNAWIKGYICRDIIFALSEAGLSYSYCSLKPNRKYLLQIPGTIVYVAKSKKYPAGHYLVKTRKGWMNPWVNFPIISPALSGFQKKLPGRPIYAIFPVPAEKC